jgi:ATP-binding cassette subfamily F protein uup
LGFRDSIQTNSVQTEVRRFSLEGKNLSGGQQKRLSLAIIFNRPDLLILDEPTDHLDLEMIEWLETYFARKHYAIYGDRFFLERVCNEIIELDNGKLYSYKGNYSYYRERSVSLPKIQSVDKAQNLFVKKLEWMRRQPKQNNKIKIASGRFLRD